MIIIFIRSHHTEDLQNKNNNQVNQNNPANHGSDNKKKPRISTRPSFFLSLAGERYRIQRDG
ncbi:MAG: hypothetical protein P1P90_03655 [Patescibacteria group bacterium]|nr:hypothetical protein [Patescibacteria group bacterium]